jgi:nicotinamide phosphoribosyltransferase
MSFSGTDTIPAILAARDWYRAKLTVGGSVPATEHSVMSAGGQDDELGTFRRLLTEVYPSGILSVVSDTWDLWRVLTEYVPALKDVILARNGKLVIRPDSGHPVKIMCGNPDMMLNEWPYAKKNLDHHPAGYGALWLLADALGCVPGGGDLPMIDHGGCIYGDGITVERCDEILGQMVNKLKLSPFNMVFGIGSYTYEFVTRDTYGWAMKATAIRMGDFKTGPVIPIFKKPVTDDGGKFSHRGIVTAWRTEESTDERPDHFTKQESTPDELDNCAYEVVFEDGQLLIDPSFETLRKRVRV